MGNIKLKNALCIECNDGKLKPCIGKRDKALCVNHYQNKARAASGQINNVSDNKKQQDKIYNKVRLIFLADNTRCAARFTVCSHKSTEIHHSKGRNEYYLDVETWIPICSQCHVWAEIHQEEAKQINISQDRLTKNRVTGPIAIKYEKSLIKLKQLA